MENSHLETCKRTFVDIARQGVAICRDYEARVPGIKTIADQFEKNLQKRLDDFNPKIMVYGIYNAGKSTLMNALIGANEAKVSDVPTTKNIQAFHWNEYTIYDTPGINAPEKDEEVSKEKLQECDVILFVMDNAGMFNLGKNYRELTDILKSGKHLLLVLNDRDGIGTGSPEIEKIKANIYRDFSEVYGKASPEKLAETVRIIAVDAQEAMEARTNLEYSTEERDILIENSNICALEDAIISEYGKVSGFTVLKELVIQLRNALDQLRSELGTLASSEEKVAKAEQLRSEIQKLRDSLIEKVTDRITDQADELDMDLFNILKNATDEDVAKQNVQNTVNSWADGINKYLLDQIKGESARFNDVLTSLSVPGILAPEAISELTVGSSGKETSGELDLNRLLKTSGGTGGEPNPVSAILKGAIFQGGFKAALPLITKLPLVGGIVAKVLGPLVPVVGPIVAIGSILYSIFGGSSDDDDMKREMAEAEARAEAERNRQMEIARLQQEMKEESRRLSRKVSSGISSGASKMIFDAFAPILKMIDDSIAQQSKENANIGNDLRKIDELKQILDYKVAAYCNR